MKIAVLSPIAWRTPPEGYGPWENVASVLTEGLVKSGHEVTLFATADSKTSATLEAVCPKPYEVDKNIDPKVYECLHIGHIMEMADKFDIIHNHFDFLPLSYSGLINTPMVTTIHGFSSEKILPVYRKYNSTTDYISISDSDRHPGLGVSGNGIPWDQFDRFSAFGKKRGTPTFLWPYPSSQRNPYSYSYCKKIRPTAYHRRTDSR